MATEADYEAALLTAASTITVGDFINVAQWFAKLVGGHDQAAALIEADREATRLALDVLEQERIDREPAP